MATETLSESDIRNLAGELGDGEDTVDLSYGRFDEFDLRNLDFASLTARYSSFFEANLEGTRLRWAKLQGCGFRQANLTNVDFLGADLRDTNFAGVDLRGVTLERANLEGAWLKGVDLRNVNLRQANVRRVGLNECVGLETAYLMGADLTGADLPEGYGWWQTSSFGTRKDVAVSVLAVPESPVVVFSGLLRKSHSTLDEAKNDLRDHPEVNHSDACDLLDIGARIATARAAQVEPF